MIKPPSPPAVAKEYLSQLAAYYRELVEYHQQAAMAAAQQLGHVEALLSNEPSHSAVETQSWLVSESEPASRKDQAITESQDEEESSEEDEGENEENSEKDSEPPQISLQMLKELLEAERGKMLHIDYIVHHFYGAIRDLSTVKPMVEEQLEQGENLRMWASVPDAKQCWTLTLFDFPDLAEKEKGHSSVAYIPSDALPTKKAASVLSIKREKIYELKKVYSEQLIEGVDYFQNRKKEYFWTKTGRDKLANLQHQLQAEQQKQALNQSASALPMLPQYRGLSKLEAIEKFLKKTPEQAFSITEVTDALYGRSNSSQAQKMRKSVCSELSRGKQEGLWSSVREKKGFYQAKKED